jgi:hypothetical protein
MKPADFIKEHLRLVKILKSGSKAVRNKEAKDQAKELKAFLKKMHK